MRIPWFALGRSVTGGGRGMYAVRVPSVFLYFNITSLHEGVQVGCSVTFLTSALDGSGQFLGAFAKLRKATISFVMCARPSVRPHATTWLPLDGFFIKFDI